jgi:2-C-methyl-D-erythritol 4-phosphate cytidylyltransferase
MNAGIPKQFLLLDGRPLLMHSLEAFYLADPDLRILVVLPESHFPRWESFCDEYLFKVPHELVPGGDTRFHSVSNAMQLLATDGLVSIHDGARPLVSAGLINRTFDAAMMFGNCIPVVPVNESVRLIANGASSPVNRDDYRIIQTPQVFRIAEIREAYRQPYQSVFTDDATVLERTGKRIFLAEGEPANIKITRPEDLAVAECLLNLRK